MASRRTLDSGKAVITLSLQDKVSQGLNKFQAKLAKIGAGFRSVGSFGVLGGGFAGIQRLLVGSAAGAALAWPVKLAANLQTAEAQFLTFTGSAEETKRVLSDIEQFSARSPYSNEALQEATRTMLSFGVASTEVVANLQNLAEVAGGDSEKLQRLALAFGQVQAKGRLMAQEVLQMVEAGFNPLQEISRVTGEDMKTLAKRMEAGGVSAGEVAKAFQSVTSEGGRFHGLLDRIGNTANGLWARFKAGVALAVRPLGQDLLPMITGFLRSLNESIPRIAAFIRANSKVATTVFWTITAIVGAAAALFSIGGAFAIASLAVGGFVTAFTAVVAIISAMLTPIGLAVTGLAALTTWFVTSTETGRTYLGALLDTVTATFGGMADAIAAGELQAATKILWAGLKLAWLQGTAGLREIWADYKLFFMENMTELVFDAQRLWVDLTAGLKKTWAEFSRWWQDALGVVIHTLAGVGETDAVKAELDAALATKVGEREQAGNAETAKIEADRAAALAGIDAAAETAAKERENNNADEKRRITDEESAARRELEAARKAAAAAAAAARDAANKDVEFERQRLDPSIGAAGDIATAGNSGKAIATLDASFAAQQFGGRTREVDLLTQIAGSTKKSADKLERFTFEGGIPGR